MRWTFVSTEGIIMLKRFFFFVGSLALLVSFSTYGEEERKTYSIELNLGSMDISEGSFNSSAYGDLALCFSSNSLIYRVGYFQADKFAHKNKDVNSEVDFSGLTIGVIKPIELDQVTFEIGGGAAVTNTQANFLNNDLGSFSDTVPYIGGGVVFPGFEDTEFTLGFRQLFDVNGSDISMFQLGFRTHFRF